MNKISTWRFFLYKALMKLRPAIVSVLLKKILGIKYHIIETKWGKFYIDPVSSFGLSLLENNEYDVDTIKVLQYFLKPSSIFLDIGANEGYFSVVANYFVGSDGRVIAVEPQNRTKIILQKNLALNNIENVTVVSEAISNFKGEALLYISPDTNTGSTSLMQTTKYSLPTQKIHTITLSDLFKKHSLPAADLMKMDIEGYEYEAILGSPDIFKKRRIKAIVLDTHLHLLKKKKLQPDSIITFLLDCGYTINKNFSKLVFVVSPD